MFVERKYVVGGKCLLLENVVRGKYIVGKCC